jgi:hypothetical protein
MSQPWRNSEIRAEAEANPPSPTLLTEADSAPVASVRSVAMTSAMHTAVTAMRSHSVAGPSTMPGVASAVARIAASHQTHEHNVAPGSSGRPGWSWTSHGVNSGSSERMASAARMPACAGYFM